MATQIAYPGTFTWQSGTKDGGTKRESVAYAVAQSLESILDATFVSLAGEDLANV